MAFFKAQSQALWNLARQGFHLSKLIPTGNICKIDGTPLHRNNSNQIVLYCSKVCRRKRHNRNR